MPIISMNNKNNMLAVICGRLRCVATAVLVAIITVSCSLTDKAVVTPPADDSGQAVSESPAVEAEEAVDEVDGVPAAQPPEPVSPTEEAQPPSSESSDDAPSQSPRGDVVWIQQRLRELGYYPGPVDGQVGKATRDAIRAYQSDQQLPQDGAATPALQDFMWRNGG